MTLVMNILKLCLVAVVAYTFMSVAIPEAEALTAQAPQQMLVHGGRAVADLGIRLSLIFFILGVADMAYQWYQQEKDMKMTKQEVKQEMKDLEGDPHIRSRRRQKQREMAMQRMMQEVPQAEVVVRNPTHYAVAIRYQSGDEAPIVVAKGKNIIAEKIIQLAIENNVPTWQDPPLARSLYRVEVGESIPAPLFPALAEVLAHVLTGEKREALRDNLRGAA